MRILMVGLDAKNLNPRVGALTRKAREPNHYLMARIIRYGQQAGLFRRDIDADQTGIVLAAVRTGLIACWRIDPEVFDLRRTTEAFVRTLLPALLGRTGGRRKIAMPKMDPEEAEAGVAEMLKSYGYSAAVLAPRGAHAKRRGPAEVMRRPNRTVKFHRATTGINRGVGD